MVHTIKVIKAPRYYTEQDYPCLPDIQSKKKVLVRNPYDTVCSLQSMNRTGNARYWESINDEAFLLSYWLRTYRNIIEKIDVFSPASIVVRYNDLVDRPVETSERNFRFIDCSEVSGVDSYLVPQRL